ncbi:MULTISPECIES: hypothetical protein [unclassified Saccharibacter]|uniref:hypothetical protein n=1 Tax=unclassified Saccharibacter TaxID=2648722 RepID=UPI00132682D5|nr:MULTISPECIES: hypothetical protein [unclassified Saccharibacter]MXV35961.1 hypothetical protein [Saccharibacter sp. EH611]MXV58916.1 hypothetical protein [Saccharibacter sp. EH70]MXV65885.1 hypothetical protein [Saccharibacter sp. EH60]
MVLDLYDMALGLTTAVNPLIEGVLRRSIGPVRNPDYSVSDGYEDIPVQMEVQALSTSDLQLLDNLQQQSDARAVYLRGAANALNRPLQSGGDVLVFDGSEWLITQVLEEWGEDEWRKVIVTRQIAQPQTSN